MDIYGFNVSVTRFFDVEVGSEILFYVSFSLLTLKDVMGLTAILAVGSDIDLVEEFMLSSC